MNKQSLKINLDTKYLLFAIVFALNSSVVWGQTYRQTLNVQIPSTLNFVNIDGKSTSYYELYLTNFSTDTFKLKKLSILDIGDSSIQFISQNQDFQNRYGRIGSAKKDTSL